jgi:CoA:oxalate CoA-transferase
MTPPLSDVLVVDLTTSLSGPYATQLLADLGARVVKVEPPTGDPTRTMPPHFINGESAYYLSVNRNKKSIVLDLKTQEDRQRFLDLVDEADLLVENFRPGVMERFGLDYELLRSRNPSLVICSITGFGLTGPNRDRPAYDAIVQAMSGGMSITGEPGGQAVRAGIPLGDISAGMIATAAGLGALLRARKTGIGAHLDVSMLDVQVSMLSYQAAYYLLAGAVAGPQGTGHVSIPTYRSFRCSDGKDVMVTANTERMWRSLCVALRVASLCDDPRFATNALRLENKSELWPQLETAFARYSSIDALALLQAAEVPVAPVRSIAEALDDESLKERNLIVDVPGSDGSRRFVGAPFRFVGEPPVEPLWPPALGQDQTVALRRPE